MRGLVWCRSRHLFQEIFCFLLPLITIVSLPSSRSSIELILLFFHAFVLCCMGVFNVNSLYAMCYWIKLFEVSLKVKPPINCWVYFSSLIKWISTVANCFIDEVCCSSFSHHNISYANDRSLSENIMWNAP